MSGFPLLLAFCVVALHLHGGSTAPAPSAATTELMITAMIRAGDLDKAKSMIEDKIDLSKVEMSKPVKSFSGYLTVDEPNNANLFFWFFPAKVTPEKAPVVLWVNDGAGITCLNSVFTETGPWTVGENNELMERNTSWTNRNNMLYIDGPVGTGFSFTDKPEAIPKTPDDEAAHLYDALSQFFTLFKEYQPNEFYMAGKTYAGALIPHIGKKIDMENGKGGLKINMKGFIMDSPWLDASRQAFYADWFYDLGLLDRMQREEVLKIEAQFQDAFKKQDSVGAIRLFNSIVLNEDSVLATYTGFENFESALRTRALPEFDNFRKFVESKEINKYLHAGLQPFLGEKVSTFSLIIKDFSTPHIDHIQTLLDKDYKLLIIAPQFNLLNNFRSILKLIRSFKWKGAAEIEAADRQIWRTIEDDDVGGYVKEHNGFAHVLLRNTGQNTFSDMPNWSYELINRFLQGKGYGAVPMFY